MVKRFHPPAKVLKLQKRLDSEEKRFIQEWTILWALYANAPSSPGDSESATLRLLSEVVDGFNEASWPEGWSFKTLVPWLRKSYLREWLIVRVKAPYPPGESQGRQPTLPPLQWTIEFTGAPLNKERFRKAVLHPNDQLEYLKALQSMEPMVAGRPYAIPRPIYSAVVSGDTLHLIRRQVAQFMQEVSLTPKEEQRRASLLQDMQSILSGGSGETRTTVHAFGSSANGLSSKTSDMDLCVEMDLVTRLDEEARKGLRSPQDAKEFRGHLITQVSRLLKSRGFTNIIPIRHSVVPIVKFTHPTLRVEGDICFGASISTANTQLFYAYTLVSPHIRPLLMVMKRWAKVRGIGDAHLDTLNSYTYCLMMFYYLQLQGNLPPLQQLCCSKPLTLPATPSSPPMVGRCFACGRPLPSEPQYGYEAYFLRGWKGHTRNSSLTTLLMGFFHFYAFEFDYAKDVVSPRLGQPLSRADKGWTRKTQAGKSALCVEDPFVLERNTARTASVDSVHGIRWEMERAWRCLVEGQGLPDLLLPWRKQSLSATVIHGMVRSSDKLLHWR
ncbi:MAG: hypothetical protein DHS80DRAFT_28621 [Piptocephalis tieghemiana]|nr:MAG: hypothetical protein DHS80DRAFT_28621 [Piptocephalis tieghemiana]